MSDGREAMLTVVMALALGGFITWMLQGRMDALVGPARAALTVGPTYSPPTPPQVPPAAKTRVPIVTVVNAVDACLFITPSGSIWGLPKSADAPCPVIWEP